MYLHIKTFFDYVFALILLVLVWPVMVCAAIAVKLDSPGPVLFKQERPGLNCKVFTLRKFRTMRVETERDGKPLSDFERMTRVGSFLRKTSIDELPQLFNILRGEMSFIGPRPLLVRYLARYTPEQNRRHSVKPGITGWAQVNGRQELPFSQRIELDLWYIKNWSLWLDVKIMFRTLWKVVARDGVKVTQNVAEVDDLMVVNN